jgi:hypothetical protein
MTLISKVTKPLSETGYMPLEDVIIPNFPKLPSHNHSCLREEVQTTSINSLQDPVFYSKVEVPIKMDFAPAFPGEWACKEKCSTISSEPVSHITHISSFLSPM